MSPATTPRKSAEERREDVLEAARDVFAEHGLSGASTDEIARRAGISQPYLFRLFRTKKDLFLATVERCHRETRETFERAAQGKTGEQALKAMGQAYRELIRSSPNRLRAQMQIFAACEDPDVRRVARRGFGELVDAVERASGADAETVSRFFAKGMLINAVASMGLQDSDSGWARTLMSFVAQDRA
jgi:AcrR family transcriptional regulator